MRNMQNMHLNSDPWLQPGLVGGLRAALRQKGGYVLGGLFAAFGLAWPVTEASVAEFRSRGYTDEEIAALERGDPTPIQTPRRP